MKVSRLVLLLVASLVVLPVAAQTKPEAKTGSTAKATSADMQILADKIKADKKLVVAANMQLTEAEAKKFWPVYDGYQGELQKINERIGKLIATYRDAYNKGPVSDETARKLSGEAVAIEQAEVDLKRSYIPKLEAAVPGVKVARYIQIENKIRAIIKYELAAGIPLVE